MVILLIYVIPKFAEIFRDLNQEVPFLTNIMLQTGIFLREYGWIFPILLLLIIWGGRRLYRKPQVRMVVDRALVRTPVTRKLVLYSELTRFCRTLGTMLHSGVPLLRALSLAQEVLINTLLKEKIAPLHREIKVGHSMSNFFRANEPFPSRIGTMLRISEEQGNLGNGLLSLGDYFERELQRKVQRLMTFMEPAVILSTGLIIGVMVLSMFTAIFGINEIRF
jgi:general secretion pathway protein F